jgi:Bacterial regulatory proteins, luxR family
LSNKEVGLKLDLQEKTVKHYMTSVMQELHLRNGVEAALMASAHFGVTRSTSAARSVFRVGRAVMTRVM